MKYKNKNKIKKLKVDFYDVEAGWLSFKIEIGK